MAKPDKQGQDDTELAFQIIKSVTESSMKFTFFLVGLTFAILGVDVQITVAADVATILGWLVLLTSGVSGVLKVHFLLQMQSNIQITVLTKEKMSNSRWDRICGKLERILGELQVWSFILGISLLALAKIF